MKNMFLVHTAQPLTELRMDLKRQEETALFSRPELLEVHIKKVNAKEAELVCYHFSFFKI